MTRDQDLRRSLEGTAAFDPAFRVQVLNRICTRASRRASLGRAAFWIVSCSLLGVLAQPLMPAETGVPAIETVVMTLSFAATIVVVAWPLGLRQWWRKNA